MTEATNEEAINAEDALPPSEVTRLGGLFTWQSILFVVLCFFGLALGLIYTFGISVGGKRLLEGEYYWVFIGLFTAAAFIALPARAGQKHIPVYDLVAAALGLGISIVFAGKAWDIVQACWASIRLIRRASRCCWRATATRCNAGSTSARTPGGAWITRRGCSW